MVISCITITIIPLLFYTTTAKLHTKILRFGSLSQKDLIYRAWTF